MLFRSAQLAALKDPRVLKYCQYYSIVFGGYVALSLWMVQYYIGEYGLDIRVAALLAACFSLPGDVLRAVGGWLSDKHGAHKVTWWVLWVSWICLFLLSYPQTDFTINTVKGAQTFHIGLNVYMFTGLMFLLILAQWRILRGRSFQTVTGRGFTPRVVPLGRWRWAAFGLCALYFLKIGRAHV